MIKEILGRLRLGYYAGMNEGVRVASDFPHTFMSWAVVAKALKAAGITKLEVDEVTFNCIHSSLFPMWPKQSQYYMNGILIKKREQG